MTEKALIFIVDDDTEWSDVLSRGLDRMGYATQTAEDIASAKTWLASGKPALIFLDVMLPDGNGIDLCRWIRTQQKLEKTPIIINSGVLDEETAKLAIQVGAAEFMHKPIRLQTLKQKLEQLLAPKS